LGETDDGAAKQGDQKYCLAKYGTHGCFLSMDVSECVSPGRIRLLT
jgi:hypothetical protein